MGSELDASQARVYVELPIQPSNELVNTRAEAEEIQITKRKTSCGIREAMMSTAGNESGAGELGDDDQRRNERGAKLAPRRS